VREMTKQNLKAAFAGESQAHMKYLAFAERAEQEGKPNAARLFRALSFAEQVHALKHLQVLGEVGSTADNLATANAGETFEVEEMYAAFVAVSELQGEAPATRSMSRAQQAEKVHANLYAQAREAVVAGQDADMPSVYVCPFCGYAHVGSAPDKCPICGAAKDQFRAF